MNRVIFLDRDGTLNRDPGYISCVKEYEFFGDTLDALEKLSRQGYKFIIVTNQSGIARGLITEKALSGIHRYIEDVFRGKGITLLGIYYCPHHPDDNCGCRKPKTALFLQAASEHSVDLQQSFIIGDSLKEVIAGRTLGMSVLLVRTGDGKRAEQRVKERGYNVDFVGDDLMKCADFILSRESAE